MNRAPLLLVVLVPACLETSESSDAPMRWPGVIGLPAQALSADPALDAALNPRVVLERGSDRVAAPIRRTEDGYELLGYYTDAPGHGDEALAFSPEVMRSLARSGRDDVRLADYFGVRIATDDGAPPKLLGGRDHVLVRVAVDADPPCESEVSAPRSVEVLVIGAGDLAELDRPRIEDGFINVGSLAIGLVLADDLLCAIAERR